MRSHSESHWLAYSPEQMFDLVADVPRYPEFLPWCISTRVLDRPSDTEMVAEMEIGFKMIRERYTSRITMERPTELHVESLDGLFKELHTSWRFLAAPQGGTNIEFDIRFAFRSVLLQTMIGAVFNEAARMMVRSFEKRAKFLYGSP